VARPGRRNARLPDMCVNPTPSPLPSELCPPGEDHSEEDWIHLDERNRVFARRRTWRGKLIEFALVQQTFVGGEWHDVIRADTCHGEVHLHLCSLWGGERREVVHAVTDVDSIERGYDVCSARLFEHAEDNVRCWSE
jgi:hypothetical protein